MPRQNNDRGRSLGKLESRLPKCYMPRRCNVARSTIVRLVQHANDRGIVSDSLRPGAPLVTSVRQDNSIGQRH